MAATSALLTNFELLNQQSLQWYQSSEDAKRGFCHTCGSSLFWQKSNRDSISIMAGTIDAPTGLSTVENIFVEDMSDYHGLPSLTE